MVRPRVHGFGTSSVLMATVTVTRGAAPRAALITLGSRLLDLNASGGDQEEVG